MDVPRFSAMTRFWRNNPPLRDMVQAYLRIKIEPEKTANKSESENTMQDFDEFMKQFTAAGGRG